MAFNFFNLLEDAGRGIAGLPPTVRQAQEGVPAALGPNAPGQRAPDTIGTEDIVANGQRQTGPVAPQDLVPRSLGNRDFIEERQQAAQNGAEAAQNKGMFGTKGVLRDVLGILGDSFLVQSGNKAIYRPQRDKEDAADAMAGFTQDPLAAAERMTGVDPAAARSMFKDQQEADYKAGALKSQEAYRGNVMQQNGIENIVKLRNYAARLLDSPGGRKNPELAMQQIASVAQSTGIPLGQLGINPDMTAEERDIYAAGDMTVQQQRNLPMRERQLDIAQQNASANTTRANRPPAGRAAPNPTAASIAAPVLEKLKRGQKLAPNEIELLDRAGYNMPTQGRGGRQRPSGRPAGLPPGMKLGRKIN